MTTETETVTFATPFTFGGRKRKAIKNADGTTTQPAPFAKIERVVEYDKLPKASQLYAARYGILQYLSDGANTATTDTEFAEAIDERIRKLNESDFTITRGEIAPTNDPEVLAKQLARQEVGAAITAAKATVTKEQRAAAVEAYFTGHHDRLVKLATDQIEARKSAAGAVDLNALLGLTPPPTA